MKESHLLIKLPDGVLGLTRQEAARRLKHYGLNEIAEKKQLSLVASFLLKFANPLILILVIAAIIAAALGERMNPAIIITIVVISVTLDFINTYKSERAAEALKERVKITATIIRDGQARELPLSHIVPDDIIFLSPGDLIPADGKIIQEKDFFIDESSLTGESFPVEKSVGAEVFMGSSAVTGDAFMSVTVTGKNTKFGKIAESLAHKEEPTDFDRGMKDFSVLIMKITFLLVIFVFLTNALWRHEALESLLFAAALAVGLTPELLPMIIALNLTRGSLAMAKHGVIVKKLSAIQNFGSMDVLCTDKTGTLTENKIALVKYVDGLGRAAEDVFFYAYLNSQYQSGYSNPLDAAVIEHKSADISGYKKIDEIPFDYARKRNAVIVEQGNEHVLIAKGAPEELFGVCNVYLVKSAEGDVPQKAGQFNRVYGKVEKKMDEEALIKIHQEYDRLSHEGFRVLGVAIKKIKDQKKVYSYDEERDMVFCGFMAFLDPPKTTAAETLKLLEKYGIEIKIITGDNALVSRKVARDIDLPVKGVLTGIEMEQLNDYELRTTVEETTVFARISPDQKTRIIRLLQKNKHAVGFLGDGINDAPSLKAADVGISVNNAVDVAKESADLILVEKSLRELVEGVILGRTTFANTMKYLMMTLSSNFGNMFSMAAASMFIPFLPMLPVQILLNNLLYDGSQFTIPLDRVDSEDVLHPKKWDMRFIKRFMLVFGPASSFFDFLTFAVLFYGFNLVNGAFQTGWFLESIATQIFVVYIIRTKKLPFLESWPSPLLIFSALLAVFAAWAISFSSLGKIFGLVSLPVAPLLSIAVITALYLVVVEILKRRFYRKYAAVSPA
ncbi:MAG: magnesium-translocating P-type ATPase [Candidatus Niyogibacteria bacterium]|nr:magnesium-translocating P-type ATPase [Candidatus Niyogibacteria bacterium]